VPPRHPRTAFVIVASGFAPDEYIDLLTVSSFNNEHCLSRVTLQADASGA
jgi:hypothetical protein